MVQVIRSAKRSARGTGLGFSHKEALRAFIQSCDGEEDKVAWAGEGKWEVETVRKVSYERKGDTGPREDCGLFKRFETGLVTLEPKMSFRARNSFLAKCPNVGKTQTRPLLVLRL